MKYWLFKTEPDAYSIHDLEAAGVDLWDGIRNYQARNFIRDEMRPGDKVLIYHSRVQPPGVVGEAEIASEPYPDPTQFDPVAKYHDPKSDPDNPRWMTIDVRHQRTYAEAVPLPELKQTPGLEDMMVVKKGMRLSIQPVTAEQWRIVRKLAGAT